MEARAVKRRSNAASTYIVVAASVLSSVLGFGREILNAHFYGTDAGMDAYLNACVIPQVLFGIFNAALAAALIPVLSEYVSAGLDNDVRQLGSSVLNVLLPLMSVLAVIGIWATPALVPLIAHGFSSPEQLVEIRMVRWMMPGIIANSLSNVCSALLNANGQFLAPGLIWVCTNITVIAFVLFFHQRYGIFALVLGTVAGYFAQLLVQIPSILNQRLYRFRIEFGHPGLKRVLIVLLPIALGSGASQINLAFDRYFAAMLKSGATSAIGYTTKLVLLPVIVVAGSIATVTFPLVARHFASGDLLSIRRSTATALRMVTFVVMPCATILCVLAFPIIQTLFERGAFGASATNLCSSLVPFATLSLITLSYNTVLAQSCYACKQARIAVFGSAISVGINIALSAAWLPTLEARGLLLANGVAGIFLVAFQIMLLWRITKGFEWKQLLSSITRIGLASLSTAVALRGILAFGYVPSSSPVARIVYLTILLAAALATFVVASRLLKVSELDRAVSGFVKRFKVERRAAH